MTGNRDDQIDDLDAAQKRFVIWLGKCIDEVEIFFQRKWSKCLVLNEQTEKDEGARNGQYEAKRKIAN